MPPQLPAESVEPRRSIRRAKPLSPESHWHDRIHDRAGAPDPSTNGFRTSFKRTFRDFKDRSTTALARSRSLGTQQVSTHASPEARLKGHSRSLIDVSAMVPIHTASPPPEQVSPVRPRGPALSVVSEGIPYQHSPAPAPGDIKTLQTLRGGTLMTKVSAKKQKDCWFRLEADLGQIVWMSKAQKIIPIESIEEIRSGDDARYAREHFQLAEEYQDRWLTIIYILDGRYKTLHLIARNVETFQMWDRTLRTLHGIRKDLMRGLGNGEMRQALWEKQYWKTADEGPDQKATFIEVEGLCKKLNINTNRDDLERLFKQADKLQRGYLDFDDFRRFVKLLKARPEIERIYKNLCAGDEGRFDLAVFENFLKDDQKSTLDTDAVRALFIKYSTIETSANGTNIQGAVPALIMTMEAFTSFLLSPDNSAFIDQHSDVSQLMTHPLPDYFISSSHNTYLVGHQLVGASSTEGYIRALLHGCRSVEIDIYDGESEPMVFHGKSLTSKVSLREVCKAIMKYGFNISPYPIIISAEIHCSVPQQGLIAAIMIEVFGDALVRMPAEGMGKIKTLPSPEELKGKILLKAKNQNLVGTETIDSDPFISDMSSASDSEAFYDMAREQVASPISATPADLTMKEHLTKASSMFMHRVKSITKKSSSTVNEGLLIQSPAPMNSSEATCSPTTQNVILPPSPQEKQGILQRARRSLRGSSSSASDGPGGQSETSASSVDAYPPAPSQSFTFMQRIRMGKPESPEAPPMPSPTRIGVSGGHMKRTRSPKRGSAPTPETVFAQSPPPLSAFSVHSPPPSAALKPAGAVTPAKPRLSISDVDGRTKLKMSPQLLSLLVYTVGVKCRGINKKEEYAPEHMFSLSERTAHKMLRFGMWDLIKHTKTHLVRTYPKGTRVRSTNYEPHRFWAAGAQLVALNWQTFDLGYMINYAMFQRNGRSGYVLKPDAIRLAHKDLLAKRTGYVFRVKIISGQQLPRPKDVSGREIGEVVDPYVEVTLFVPDWPIVADHKKPSEKDKVKVKQTKTPDSAPNDEAALPPATSTSGASSQGYSFTRRTSTVKKNGFNPVWEEHLALPFDCAGDMMDLIFVRFSVKQEVKDSDEPLAVYCASLGSLQQGYRHLPLHDSQMSQYLFSTLFVRISIDPVSKEL